MSRYSSPLGRLYKSPANPEEIKKKCREAAKNGLLVLKYEDCKDDWERQFWKIRRKSKYSIKRALKKLCTGDEAPYFEENGCLEVLL